MTGQVTDRSVNMQALRVPYNSCALTDIDVATVQSAHEVVFPFLPHDSHELGFEPRVVRNHFGSGSLFESSFTICIENVLDDHHELAIEQLIVGVRIEHVCRGLERSKEFAEVAAEVEMVSELYDVNKSPGEVDPPGPCWTKLR